MATQRHSQWVTASDGLPAWRTGAWAREKLDYLSRYFDIFNSGMKKKWSERVYIDLFCGAGRLVVATGELEGSALLALKSKIPFTRYFFNDIEPRAVEALRRRAAQLGGPSPSYFCQDCNTAIAQIRSALPASSLDLAFVDPSNWQIAFDSVAALTQNRRMDLVITFHVGGMKRAADSHPESLDSFFGSKIWRDAYRRTLKAGRREGSRILLDCYEAQLQKLGYQWVVDDVRITNSRHVGLYHLVFASKNRRGEDFWEKITVRSASGQMRLFREAPAEYMP